MSDTLRDSHTQSEHTTHRVRVPARGRVARGRIYLVQWKTLLPQFDPLHSHPAFEHAKS